MEKVLDGNVHAVKEPRKQRYAEKERQLANLKQLFDTREMDRGAYIAAVSRHQGVAHDDEGWHVDDLDDFEGEAAAVHDNDDDEGDYDDDDYNDGDSGDEENEG